MRRLLVVLPVALAFLAACSSSGGGSTSGNSRGGGDEPAITVDSATVSTDALLGELRTIAANQAFAKELKKDDVKLVPKPGTIDPDLAAAWVSSLANQVIVDREFAARGLTIAPGARVKAREHAAKLFVTDAAFDALPKKFQDLVLERQERIDALQAALPQSLEPTEADVQQLFARTQPGCQDAKLVAQIVVPTRADADAVAAELDNGADFAALARSRSTDADSAAKGGLLGCIGSPLLGAAQPTVLQTAQAMPVGADSEPFPGKDGFTILRTTPFTLENARPLLVETWHQQHPSPLGDLINQRLLAAKVKVAKRFALVQPTPDAVAITGGFDPVKLSG